MFNMLDEILVGLKTISSLLGYTNTCENVLANEDFETISYQTSIMCVKDEAQQYHLEGEKESRDLYTLDGENRYRLFQLSDSYIIYDKKEKKIEEFSFSQCPYSNAKDALYVYCNESKYIKYGYVDDVSYYNLEMDCYVDEIISKKSIDDSEVGEWNTFTSYGDDVKKISNSFYFENLNSLHGYNADGTCAVVAIQILLGYYDTFYNDNIIDERFDVGASEYKDNYKDFIQSPGTGENFHKELISFLNDRGISSNGIGMNFNQEKKLTQKYLNSRNIDFDYKWIEGNWSDTTSNRASKHLREAIDNDRPVFIGGAGHATVAFAYDSKYVYVHSGWGDIRRTPWETYDTNFWDLWGGPHTIEITNIANHYDSDNYYSLNLNKYICPCGKLINSKELVPTNFGFPKGYYFSEVEKEVNYQGLKFNTKRLRCGCIDEQFLNLSPLKERAGLAYLELDFNTDVRKIIVNMSMWGNNECLFESSSILKLEYLDPSTNSWVLHTDLLNDVKLGTDRSNQEKYTFNFVNGCKAFRFYSTAKPQGDRNKGRTSIGRMTIEYF